ncbi:MAG TPA: transposase [Gaiellaceae bacterium]|jgi:REP element-mobilizing transposase RayT|nr:transposase [Gaiellaceae bacterium]
MAPLRVVDPQGIYHVMSRGNYRRTIFPDEAHYRRHLFLVQRVSLRRGWVVLDWCLMPNHYHLEIQLTDGGLSEGMRELNGCFSRWSNAVHALTGYGHLVRNRFKSKHVETDEYALQLARYIARNPVQADLVKEPADWPWSGYRAFAGLEHPLPFHRPECVLRLFHEDPRRARRQYRLHVEGGPVSDGLDLWSDHRFDVVESPS